MKRLLTLALMATLFACGGNDSTGPAATVTGTYTLTKVNNQTPPVTVYQDATVQVIILSGGVTLSANHTWTGHFVTRSIVSGVSDDEDNAGGGTWTQSGNTLTLTDASDNSTTAVTVGTNTLTATLDLDVPIGNVSVVFSK